MTKRLSILALLVIASITAYNLTNANAATATKFELTNKYLITVQVFLNNEGPYDFLFDVGSTMTTVEPSLAAQLKLSPTQGATIITASQQSNTNYSFINRVAFNGKTVPKVACLITNLSEIQRLNPKIRGVLGGNYLAHFSFLIDYKTRTITFEEADEVGASLSGFLLPSKFNANRSIVQASISGAQFPVRLTLDSAISSIVLFQQADRPFAIPVTPNKNTTLTTLNGSTLSENATIRELLVGQTTLTNQLATLIKNTEALRDEDGLLPTSLFRSVYINNKAGIVMLNPVLWQTSRSKIQNQLLSDCFDLPNFPTPTVSLLQRS